jgi:ubiquinone/menaquinone biosynthesis C-methylase UbiE
VNARALSHPPFSNLELICWKGYECWSFAQLVSTATRHYRLLRSKRGFAATSAHSARHVSIPFFKTFVQIVAAGSSLVQLGHRKTGKVTTILARTRQARSADKDRLISRNTRGSPQRSESFHRNSGKPGVNILTKTGRLRQKYGTIDQVFKTLLPHSRNSMARSHDMNAIVKETQTTKDFDQLNSRLKATWMTGNYDLFSCFTESNAEQFFRRLGVTPGTRLLDVGCGAGRLALIAARAGAQVIGCDISTNWLEKARARAAAERLEITFEEGDAESLPYEDAQFDAVVSLIGAMFAPRPDRVAAELTRVCRPGGMIAMANWTPDGFAGQMFKAVSKHIAPSGMPAPVLWGDEATVRDRLREGIADLKCALRFYYFDYPFPPDRVVDFYRANYGPMSRAFASLDGDGQESLRSELVRLWSAHNKAVGDTTKVDAEYLEVIAITRAA